jgi:hypothetical protein
MTGHGHDIDAHTARRPTHRGARASARARPSGDLIAYASPSLPGRSRGVRPSARDGASAPRADDGHKADTCRLSTVAWPNSARNQRAPEHSCGHGGLSDGHFRRITNCRVVDIAQASSLQMADAPHRPADPARMVHGDIVKRGAAFAREDRLLTPPARLRWHAGAGQRRPTSAGWPRSTSYGGPPCA